jgi:hypothetical protein
LLNSYVSSASRGLVHRAGLLAYSAGNVSLALLPFFSAYGTGLILPVVGALLTAIGLVRDAPDYAPEFVQGVKVRRYGRRRARAVRKEARSAAKKADRRSITEVDIDKAWEKVVASSEPSTAEVPAAPASPPAPAVPAHPTVPAVSSRVALVARAVAVLVVAGILYLVFAVAVPKLPLSHYWEAGLTLAVLAVLYLTLTGGTRRALHAIVNARTRGAKERAMSERPNPPSASADAATERSFPPLESADDIVRRFAVGLPPSSADRDQRTEWASMLAQLMVRIALLRLRKARGRNIAHLLARLTAGVTAAVTTVTGGTLLAHVHGSAATALGLIAVILGVIGAAIAAVRPGESYATDLAIAARPVPATAQQAATARRDAVSGGRSPGPPR